MPALCECVSRSLTELGRQAWSLQLCRAVSHCHHMRVLHRDPAWICCFGIWEFPKNLGVPYLGVLIVRILLFKGTILGSPISGNCHLGCQGFEVCPSAESRLNTGSGCRKPSQRAPYIISMYHIPHIIYAWMYAWM